MVKRPWISIGVLAVLCVVDWGWTVAHLGRGVEEANPLLAWAYTQGGIPLFSACKLGMTAPAIALLAWQRHHRLARRLVPWTILVYGLVLGAHVATEAMLATL